MNSTDSIGNDISCYEKSIMCVSILRLLPSSTEKGLQIKDDSLDHSHYENQILKDVNLWVNYNTEQCGRYLDVNGKAVWIGFLYNSTSPNLLLSFYEQENVLKNLKEYHFTYTAEYEAIDGNYWYSISLNILHFDKDIIQRNILEILDKICK